MTTSLSIKLKIKSGFFYVKMLKLELNSNMFRDYELFMGARGNCERMGIGSPQMGTLKMSLPKIPSLKNSRLLLLSIITITSKVFSNVPRLFISGAGLEGSRQHLYIIKRLHVILSHPVTNQRAHHGWARRKVSNIRVPRRRKRQFWE